MTILSFSGKDRCHLGKSCGASCISSLKRCVIELGEVFKGSLDKLKSRVSGVFKKEPSPLEGSPKYDKTLGSRTPLEKGKVTDKTTLADVYKMQGFNSKPELVAKRTDLLGRGDTLRDSSGAPVMFYRGVSNKEYSNQFKGAGENGGVHFPGKGVYGDGTYAAASSVKDEKASRHARNTAISYSQPTNVLSLSPGKRELNRRVTAFSLRRDANLVQFEGTPQERHSKFWEWANKTVDAARKQTGVPINDVGLAAAIMGIHAYQVPLEPVEGRKFSDYWVILNRGAVIAAVNPELYPKK